MDLDALRQLQAEVDERVGQAFRARVLAHLAILRERELRGEPPSMALPVSDAEEALKASVREAEGQLAMAEAGLFYAARTLRDKGAGLAASKVYELARRMRLRRTGESDDEPRPLTVAG